MEVEQKEAGQSAKPVYQRILLKLSGEALQGGHPFGIDAGKLFRVIQEIAGVMQLGVQVILVIGGGNLVRGTDLCAAGFNRIAADKMGMLATVINGLALRDAFEKESIQAMLMSAFTIPGIVEQYDSAKVKEILQQGKIVLLTAGTGNPLVTTDSAAALRGIESNVDIVLKATKVDGVFNDDPIQNPIAERYHQLSYNEVVEKRLRVMDLTAVLLCQEHALPVRVFNMNRQGALKQIMLGENIGTLIGQE